MTARVILITGGSSGLGAALARHVARPGIHLILTGRDAARLSAVADDCRARGAEVSEALADCADPAAMDALIRQHQPETVIANAGLSGSIGADGALESPQQIAALFGANLHGMLNTVTPAAALMAARRQGRIAIISSIASYVGMESGPSYSASKAAARIYGEALRGALARHNVHVTVVVPGFIATPMSERYLGQQMFKLTAEQAAARIWRAIDRGAARLVFPWHLALGMKLLGLAPAWLHDRILARFRFTVAPRP